MPASAAPLRTPDRSLADESGTFERTLLGEIRHIGVCPHTIRFGLWSHVNPYGTFRLDMERQLELDRGPTHDSNGSMPAS